MKIAITGFPQVGKKTLFELLTGARVTQHESAGAKSAQSGIAKIRDERFTKLVDMYRPKKEVPGNIEFMLLPDMQLDAEFNREVYRHLENADAVCYIARAFFSDSVYHIAGSVSPERDIENIIGEFIIMDQIFVEKRIERLDLEIKKKGEKDKIAEKEMLLRLKAHLEEEQPLRIYPFTPEEQRMTLSYAFVSRKPMVVVINIDDSEIKSEERLKALEAKFAGHGIHWIQVAVKSEKEISEIEDPEERKMFLDDLGIKDMTLDRFTIIAYKALGLITFFTVGEDEVRAWMCRINSFAPQAAKVIHQDFEKGFIRAEVIKYSELMEAGSEQKLKEKGKLYMKGKDYIVEDGDILHILFNV